ncbi:unnamed protein product [Calypogeia fissa]
MASTSDSTHHHPPGKEELSTQIKERPNDITLLNDSVYELYSSHGRTPQAMHKVVVIFFHGLPQSDEHHHIDFWSPWYHHHEDIPKLDDCREAFWRTWLSRDGTVVWPKDWLGESLEKIGIQAQILSISYDSYILDHPGEMDSYQIAENLMSDIIFTESPIAKDCPVVLVGHCLGGIVIKKFLVHCLNLRGQLANKPTAQRQVKKIDNFMGNCNGVFYYSTPHNGTKVADYLTHLPRKKLSDPLIHLLNTLSSETARINSEFANARAGEGIRTQTLAESLDTTYMGFKGKFVEEGSGRQDVEGYYTVQNANHFEVCRARNNKWCNIHQNLLFFIKDAAEDRNQG